MTRARIYQGLLNIPASRSARHRERKQFQDSARG